MINTYYSDQGLPVSRSPSFKRSFSEMQCARRVVIVNTTITVNNYYSYAPPASISSPKSAKKQKKRKKGTRVDLSLGEGAGVVLRTDECGEEWRTVPGFSAQKLQVSSKGYYMVCRNGGWTNSSKGVITPDNRYSAQVDSVGYAVSRLVCRAFEGPAPSPKHEADHIDRDTTNNEAFNLRWASKKTNIANRRKNQKGRATGKPILIRGLDWTEDCEWEWFASAAAAGAAYGVHYGNLRIVAHTRAGTNKGPAQYQHKGFVAMWAPPPETQEDLQAGDDSNLLEPPPPAGNPKLAKCPEAGASTTKEEWRQVDTKLWVSDRGRVQTKDPRGDNWSLRRTPQPTDGRVYASVAYKGKLTAVHTVVYLTFGRRLLEGETIDHKVPSRKFDNRLVNLRPATRSEQNLNRNYKPRSEINNSMKKAVWGKPVGAGEEAWEWFESTKMAQDVLHARDPSKSFDTGAISACARGKSPKAYEWVFKRA